MSVSKSLAEEVYARLDAKGIFRKSLNADTSVIRKTAVNGVWETENKLEREIARTVGSDIDVGIYGSAVAIGGVPDETSSVNVKAIVERILGPVTSWQVKKDIIGYTIHAKVARSIPNAARSTNAVVAKALNARRVARNADYVWSVGQSKMVFPEGMTQKVKGKILRIKEAAYGDTKYLYVEYIDPRDGTKYSGWFNDQTDRPAHAREMNEGRFI